MFGGKKTREPREKPSEQDENNNILNPLVAVGWNQTQATLVEGKRS